MKNETTLSEKDYLAIQKKYLTQLADYTEKQYKSAATQIIKDIV
ncbi:MAG TPA: hypothetical protein VLI69_05525 [Gammaproteobacteria bacterium]|nr:hypothetical protein [Gammaproteobacteria bacterium]